MAERKTNLALRRSLLAAVEPGNVITAEIRSYAVPDEREHRNYVYAREREAKELWKSMDPDSRAALSSLVSEALLDMAQDPEAWLETSLVATGNQTIGVSVLFRLGNLDDQVLVMRARREAERLAQIADLERMSSGTHAAAG